MTIPGLPPLRMRLWRLHMWLLTLDRFTVRAKPKYRLGEKLWYRHPDAGPILVSFIDQHPAGAWVCSGGRRLFAADHRISPYDQQYKGLIVWDYEGRHDDRRWGRILRPANPDCTLFWVEFRGAMQVELVPRSELHIVEPRTMDYPWYATADPPPLYVSSPSRLAVAVPLDVIASATTRA